MIFFRHLSQDKMFFHINDVHYKAGGRVAKLEAEKKELELEVERLRHLGSRSDQDSSSGGGGAGGLTFTTQQNSNTTDTFVVQDQVCPKYVWFAYQLRDRK